MAEELDEILEIEPEKDTIADLIEKMENLKQVLLERRETSLIPFLEAYLKITRGVKEARENDEFDNPEALENLDLKFAQLYFRPLRKYLLEDEKTSPWRNYFDYIERDYSIPLLELLLGINAHVNSDLATVIHETGYSEEKDYRRVNGILRDKLFETLRYLAFQHRDAFSLGAYAVHPAALKGLEKVETWRELTWDNSHSESFSQERIERLTEENAEKLIELFHDRSITEILEKPVKYSGADVRLS